MRTRIWSGRAAVALAALALALAPLGCKRSPRMVSTVEMSNLNAETQLVSGFYTLENGAWRWTKQKFSVALATPPGAGQNGARLRARVTIPETLVARLGAVTLAAGVNGQALPPETYSAAGNYTYERSVPASLLQGQRAAVDFALDKAMPPSGADLRELGIVVLSVGLEPQ